jgi:hypothetical protein
VGLFIAMYVPPVSDTGHCKKVTKLPIVPMPDATPPPRSGSWERIETSLLDLPFLSQGVGDA